MMQNSKILFYITFLFSITHIFAQNDIRIVSANENMMTILYERNELGVKPSIGDDLEYRMNEFLFAPRVFFIIVPSDSKIKLNVISQSTKTEKINLNQYQGIISDDFINEFRLNSTKINYEKKNTLENLGYFNFRKYNCAAIKINTQFLDLKNNIITSYDSLLFSIEYDVYNTETTSEVIDDSYFNGILDSKFINYEIAKRFIRKRTLIKNNAQTNLWYDSGNDYYKFSTYEENIYRLTYADLFPIVNNLNYIDPRQIKLYKKGFEIPIYVSGEEDGSFDQDDYIEFWCDRNVDSANYKIYNNSLPYNNYYNLYTDSTYIWLNFNGNRGKRVSTISNVNTFSDTIKSSKVFTHFEKDTRLIYFDAESPSTQLPFLNNKKVWTWFPSWELSGNSINFNINQEYLLSDLKLVTRAISYASPIGNKYTHGLGISINNSEIIDTVIFGDDDRINFYISVPRELLNDGQNTINFHKIFTGIEPNWFEIDWVDLEYEKEIVNESNTVSTDYGKLKIDLSNKNITKKQRNVLIEKITDKNFSAYRTNPQLMKIDNFEINDQISSNSITFSDTTNSESKYFISELSQIGTPTFLYKKKLEYLTDANNQFDYIIIGHTDFRSVLDEYGLFIEQNYDVKVKIVYIDDIFDQFSYGYPFADAIKSFLSETYDFWNSTKLSFVLLVGDANYDFKNNWSPAPTKIRKNFIPSYGIPVSDQWFACVDTNNINIPQFYIGRLPVQSVQEFENYFEKHKEHLNNDYADWNKKVILFSGGYPDNASEMNILKSTNSTVSEILSSSDFRLNVQHFYKIADPLSNFGPYSAEFVQNKIDSGAFYISYLGHSGTQTWDNGITEFNQLNNNVSAKTVISDFGCSTGKFAEPDIESFSELFVNSSSSNNCIAYLGNSSLGYLSLSTIFPKIFANNIISNPNLSVGECHYLSKMELFNNNGGFSNINRVFNYCNVLIGDPIINMKLPSQVNLLFENNSFEIEQEDLTEIDNSVNVLFTIKNNGKYVDSTFTMSIVHKNNEITLDTILINIEVPEFKKKLVLKIPTYNQSGKHDLIFNLDSEQKINEIYETDNNHMMEFYVNQSTIRSLNLDMYYSYLNNELKLLNPFIYKSDNFTIQFSNDESFSTFQNYKTDYGEVITKFNLEENLSYSKYWWRAKNSGDSSWSAPASFTFGKDSVDILIQESNRNISFSNTFYDAKSKSYKLAEDSTSIYILSAGGYDGSKAVIEINGNDRIGANLWGIAVAILDSITYLEQEVKLFRAGGDFLGDSLANYINSISEDKLIAISIGIEARNYFLTNSTNSAARNAIRNLGSKYIDSVGYRESWCIIGKKGAKIGSVPEAYSKIYQGPAIIDTSFIFKSNSGNIKLPRIGPVKNINSINIGFSKSDNQEINLIPIINDFSGKVDTLEKIIVDRSSIQLNLSQEKAFSIDFKIELNNATNLESPEINSFGINYTGVPELATNYQVVSVSADSVDQGQEIGLDYQVWNVGESAADSFRVTLDLVNSQNVSSNLVDTTFITLEPDGKLKLRYDYLTNFDDGYGDMKFKLSIDTEDNVLEMFEDNNVYSQPFYVIKDTVTAVNENYVSVLFNDRDIFDGEFIDPESEVKININYGRNFDLSDTASFHVFVDNKRMPTTMYKKSSSVADGCLEYMLEPEFEDGEHVFEIRGENLIGNLKDESGYKKTFNVSNEIKLIDVYNYPNPFKNNTYFTFKLPRIPDEAYISIYTVAGRLIRKIELYSDELKLDFNKIEWDGRDQDGDLVANGTYLYKIVVKRDGESFSATEKLAVVR